MIQEKTVVFAEVGQDSPAYRRGWQDGRFGVSGANDSLADWSDPERIAYHRGHRDGRNVREMLRVEERTTA